MRTIRSLSKYLAACGLALAVVFCTTSAQAAPSKGKASVLTAKGDVKYSDAQGKWLPVKNSMNLPEGATIRTGPGSYVYLAVNNKAAAVRVNENSTLRLEKMEVQNNSEGDKDTLLDIQGGTVAGDVKKVSAGSHFDLRTPNGLAGIRGTAWQVTVRLSIGGELVSTTVFCVNGRVVVSAVVNGQPVTIVITRGQSVVLAPNQTTTPTVVETDTATTRTIEVQLGEVTIEVEAVIVPPNDNPPPTPTPGEGKK